MAKNLLFFFDEKTLEILGYLIFEGKVSFKDHVDHETFVMNVSGYSPEIRGNVLPIYENETLKLRSSEIKKDNPDAELIMEMIEPFEDKDDLKRIMKEGVREYVLSAGVDEEVRKQFLGRTGKVKRDAVEQPVGLKKIFKRVHDLLGLGLGFGMGRHRFWWRFAVS